MIYRSGLLAVLLCAQLLVVAGVLYFDAAGAADETGERLLDFAADSVDRVVVSQADAQAVLRKRAEGWVVGSALPANQEKVTEVLEKLADIRSGWPVATSPSTQDRFEVAAENYQRRVEVYQGDTLAAELYLGSSPGYRRVHARSQGSDDIFSVDFSTFELPAATDDWLDKTLLGASGDISKISRGDAWALTKSDEGWLLDGPAQRTGSELDQDAATQLAERLGDLRVMGVAEAAAADGEPVLVTVVDGSGDHALRFWHDSQADEYVVGSSRSDARYSVASYVAEQIVVDLDELLVSDAEAEPIDG